MKHRIHMIGTTHFDPVWLWTWDEAMASIRSTFRSALQRMREDPDFIYSFSCPPVFEWIRNTGVDLVVDSLPDQRGLFGLEMITVPARQDSWKDLKASELLNEPKLNVSYRIAEGLGPKTQKDWEQVHRRFEFGGQEPKTFLFKTREGTKGVLQIIGFVGKYKRDVKIRYKTLLSTNNK